MKGKWIRGRGEAGSGFEADELQEVDSRTTSCRKSNDGKGLSAPRVLGTSAVSVVPVYPKPPSLFLFPLIPSLLVSNKSRRCGAQ